MALHGLNGHFGILILPILAQCSVSIPGPGRKLNVHKTFRRRPLNVLCTFKLRPVSTGQEI